MPRRFWIPIAAVGALVVPGAGGAYAYFFSSLRTTPPSLALASPSPTASSSASPGSSAAGTGTWTVAQGSLAGYRVREQFVGQSSPHEAVARTSTVSGGLTVQPSSGAFQVTGISFTAQLSGLQSVDQVAGYNVSQRDRFVSRSLNVQQYPEATFKAASVSVPASAGDGQEVALTVPGQLTIHGVTKDTTAALKGRLNGSQLDLAGSTPAPMTGFGISHPQVAFTNAEALIT